MADHLKIGERAHVRLTTQREQKMETITHVPVGVLIPILIIMGYAIFFSFLFNSTNKRQTKYSLKHLEDRLEWRLQRLQDENIELRRELRSLERKG